jgi:hypothetical protein
MELIDLLGGATENDITTVKLDSQGVVQWLVKHSSPGNSIDQGDALSLGCGCVWVVGLEDLDPGLGQHYEYVTIRYCDPEGSVAILDPEATGEQDPGVAPSLSFRGIPVRLEALSSVAFSTPSRHALDKGPPSHIRRYFDAGSSERRSRAYLRGSPIGANPVLYSC